MLLIVLLAVSVPYLVANGREAEVLPAVRASTLMLAAVVVAVALFHWRVTGRSGGLLIAVAALGWGVVAIIDLAAGNDVQTGWLAVFRFGVSLLAIAHLSRALWGPDVNTRLQARGIFLRAAVALAVLGVVTRFVLPSGWTPAGVAGVHLSLATLWAMVGGVGVLRAVERRSVLLAWLAWTCIAVGTAELDRFLAWAVDPSWLVGSAVVRGSGMLIAAVGAALAVARTASDRRTDLLAVELQRRQFEAETASEARERRHEIGNALAAIEGATLTLERHRGRLTEDQQAELEQAVLAGTEHLRRLITSEGREELTSAWPLRDIVGWQAAAAASRGVRLEVTGDLELRVLGNRHLADEVLANLLLNAERHGRTSADGRVHVEVGRAGDHVVVRVIDEGPGVPEGFEHLIFEPGVRLNDEVSGSGLGLHVARRLMRQQRGDLTCEPYAGGACFVMFFRPSSRLEAVGVEAHEVEDVV